MVSPVQPMHDSDVQGLEIAATFNTRDILPFLDFLLNTVGFHSRVRIAEGKRVVSSLVDPQGHFWKNAWGLNAVLVRLDDWNHFGAASEAEGLHPHSRMMVERSLSETLRALAAFSDSVDTPVLLCFCPTTPEHRINRRVAVALSEFMDGAQASLSDNPQIRVLTSAELEWLYPVHHYYDEAGDRDRHSPYTAPLWAALAAAVARAYVGVLSEPYRAVVIAMSDAWIQEPVTSAVFELVNRLQWQGLAVGICAGSGATAGPLDSVDCYRGNPDEMPLDQILRDFAARAGVVERHMVYLDSDRERCAQLRTTRPQVLTLELPQEPREWTSFLRHVWVLDGPIAGGSTPGVRRRMSSELVIRLATELREPTSLIRAMQATASGHHSAAHLVTKHADAEP